MEHYSKGQYDDDLTVGMDHYNEDFDAGGVDLFEYIGDEDSPLARLKSIILSIDWEISDDILRQFNEELLDLKDIWAGNKVNLIYVQALEKLSKYIYKEKADAHPNAIKLLLSFYGNLEKIVSDEALSEKEKKSILVDDIQRFEKLKKQISRIPEPVASPVVEVKKATPPIADHPPAAIKKTKDISLFSSAPEQIRGEDPLLNLKAIVYGIDWEITERDLINLSREVAVLEEEFKSSKARCIFLQGIGSLGAYINLKRSDAHADAFKLLHSFFLGLEKVVKHNLSPQQEKEVLLPEVQKFNTFKAQIAETISPEAIARSSERDEEEAGEHFEEEIQPAFSDMPDDVHGFREDEVLESIREKEEGLGDEENIEEFLEDEALDTNDRNEGELTNEMESRLAGLFTEPGKEEHTKLDAAVALQGVDVESDADDESDEEPLPESGGELIPALVTEMPGLADEDAPAVLSDKLDEFFDEPANTEMDLVGRALPGVDVETEADDESEEEPLPYEGGELAPALASRSDEEQVVSLEEVEEEEFATPEIDERVDSFFGEFEDGSLEETHLDVGETDVPADDAGTLDVGTVVVDAQSQEDEEEFVAEERATADVEDRFDALFGSDDSVSTFSQEDSAIRGTQVETEDDTEDEEDTRLLENGEMSPALTDTADDFTATSAVDFEIEAEDFGDMMPTAESKVLEKQTDHEITEAEELITSEKLNVETATADDLIAESTPERGDTSIISQTLPSGLDVEVDDDDSGEEPLLIEDGEFAPALSGDSGVLDAEDGFGSQFGEDSESQISDQFDSFFGQTDQDTDSAEIGFFEEEEAEETGVHHTISPEIQPFEEAGFEEVWDDIEEIPTQFVTPSPQISGSIDEKVEDDDDFFSMKDDAISTEDELALLFGGPGSATGSSDELYVDDDVSPALTVDADDLEDEFTPAFSQYSDDFRLKNLAELEDVEEIPDEHVISLYDAEEVQARDIQGFLAGTDLPGDTFERIAGIDDSRIITHPEGDEDFIIGIEEQVQSAYEEEVIFQAFDDDDDETSTFFDESEDLQLGESVQADAFDSEFIDSQTFGTELLSDDRESQELRLQDVNIKTARKGVRGDQYEERIGDSFGLLPEEGGENDTADAYVNRIGEGLVPDNLNGLRNCIVALGLEIEDTILAGLTDEIAKLRLEWMAKPLEKTLLQLLSTVAQHIEKNRYESDPEANSLLLSVFDKLEFSSLVDTDPVQAQEALLAETSKVLQWQQRLLERTPPPHRIDAKMEAASRQVTQKQDARPGIVGKGDEGILPVHSEKVIVEEGAGRRAELTSAISSIVQKEIQQLQKAFHLEIQELKNELLRLSSRE